MLGLTMMSAQAFAYNAVFFTYGLVLTTFMHANGCAHRLLHRPVRDRQLPRAAAARAALRHGRPQRDADADARRSRAACSTVTAILFQQQKLTAITLTALWCVVFFFASAAASAAYLTVSEVFPLEIRAMAIAFFYAVGTGARRHHRPGALREADRLEELHGGDGRLPDRCGLAARRRGRRLVPRRRRGAASSLEDVAEPLSSTENDDEEPDREAADEPTQSRAPRDRRLPGARGRALVAALLVPRRGRPARRPGRRDRARGGGIRPAAARARAPRAHERAALGAGRRAARAPPRGRRRAASSGAPAVTSRLGVLSSTRRARRSGATRARGTGRARSAATA